MRVNWKVLKHFVDSHTNVNLEYVDLINKYWVKAFRARFEIECTIEKDGKTAQTEFEASYKAVADKDPVDKVSRVHGDDSYAISPRCWSFTGTAAATTTHDKLLDASDFLALSGGIVWCSNPTIHDWIEVAIVDVAGAYYPAGTKLDNFVPEWKMMPGQNFLTDISISSALPPGLYARLTYHSDPAATAAPSGVVNLIAHKVT